MVVSLREAKQLADDAMDNATSAVIEDRTDQPEESAWFLCEAGRNGCQEPAIAQAR